MRWWLVQVPIVLRLLLSSATALATDNCEEADAFSTLQPVKPRLSASPASEEVHGSSIQVDGTIPKIVHHVYKTDISSGPWPNSIWQQSFAAWKVLFPEPEFTHMFWSDDKVHTFVKQHCPKYFKVFTEERRDIVRSDFSRYCILWRLGGIYADLDYEPLHKFYADLVPGKVNLVQSPYSSETYQNSLMASPPHHMYWEKLMDLALFTMSSKNVLLAAGPQLLDTLPMTYSSAVHALSCNEFQRATHTSDEKERKASFSKNCKIFAPDDFSDAGLKGIHWGTVSYAGLLHNSAKAENELPAGLGALFASLHERRVLSHNLVHEVATLGAA